MPAGTTLASLLVRLGVDISGFQKGLDKAVAKLDRVGDRLQNIGSTATAAVTVPLAGAGAAVLKFGGDFDEAMTQSLAIMGDVSDSMRTDLSNAARQMAKETTFSATDSAKAIYYLASAGFDAEQSIKGLPVVAKFAQAGQMDMAIATDQLSTSLFGLGLASSDAEMNMKQMRRVADVLADASVASTAEIGQFADALAQGASAGLRLVNKDVEEGVAVLAAYAQAGTKGAEAGENFGQVLRDLQTRAIKNKETFKRYGIEVFDAAGNVRNMADIIEDMERAFGKLTVEQRRAALGQLEFQDRSVTALAKLIGFSGEIRRFEERFRNAGGAVETITEKQLKSFISKMTLMKNRVVDVTLKAFPSFAASIERTVIPAIDRMIGKVDELVDRYSQLTPEQQDWVTSLGIAAAAAGPVLLALGLIAKLLSGMAGGAAFAWGVLSAHPFVGVAAAVAALGVETKRVSERTDAWGAIARAAYQPFKVLESLFWDVVTVVSDPSWYNFVRFLVNLAGAPLLVVNAFDVLKAKLLEVIGLLNDSKLGKLLILGLSVTIPGAAGVIKSLKAIKGEHDAITAAANAGASGQTELAHVTDGVKNALQGMTLAGQAAENMSHATAEQLAELAAANNAVAESGKGGITDPTAGQETADVLADLAKALEAVSVQEQLLGNRFNATAARLSAYEAALQGLSEVSGGQVTPKLRELAAQIDVLKKRDIFEQLARDTEQATAEAALLNDETARIEGIANATKSAYEKMAEAFGSASAEAQDLLNTFRGLEAVRTDAERLKVEQDVATGANRKGASVTTRARALKLEPDVEIDLRIAEVQQDINELFAADIQGPELAIKVRELEGLEAAKTQMETLGMGIQAVFSSVASAFSTTVQGIIQGTTTIQEGFAQMGLSILLSWTSSLIQMVAEWAAKQLTMLAIRAAVASGMIAADWAVATNSAAAAEAGTLPWIIGAAVVLAEWLIAFGTMIAQAVITGSTMLAEGISAAWGWAVSAAAAAANSVANIPYVGPILAVAAAATVIGTLGAIIGMAASARQGSGPLMADTGVQLHKGEMVMPRRYAKGFSNIIEAGGNVVPARGQAGNEEDQRKGGNTFKFAPVIQAMDSQGVDRVLERHGHKFMRMADKRRRQFDPSTRRRG